MFLPSTPAHYIILLAAERIGTAIICRDDIPEELCFAIRKSKSNTAFVMDYTSKEDEQLFRETTPMTRMIKVSPYCYADKASVPDYVEKEIASRYINPTDSTEDVLTWDEFMALGENYTEDYRAERNPNRAVFGAYTSGSTGISKLVIHSSSNMVAVAFQMSIFIPPSPVQEKWWLPILPPALIAVTVSMTLFPLSAGLIVVLDPFCPISDVDIAFMEQKPNFWALVPFLCEILMKSDRIPEDYDMSHLRTLGTGAEAMNERNKFSNAFTGSLGNLGAIEDETRVYSIYRELDLLFFVIYAYWTAGLFALFNAFITLCFGAEYCFSTATVAVLVTEFYVSGQRKVNLLFREAKGLFWYDRYKPLFESAINLAASLLLVQKFGVAGILGGTVISTVTTCLWMEPYILMRYGIREDWQGKLKDYFVRYAERAAVVAALAAVSYGWVSFCPAKNIGWFLLDGVLYTLLFGAVMVVLYRNTPEFDQLKGRVMAVVKRRKE